MKIDRTTLDDAQVAPGRGEADLIAMIDEALANGKAVIVGEHDGSESLLQPADPASGKKYKTTPIGQT